MSQIIFGGESGSFTPAVADKFFYPLGGQGLPSSFANDRTFILPAAGRISDLKIKQTVAPGVNKSNFWSITDGTDSLNVTISGAATEATSTGSVTFSAGVLLKIAVFTTAAAPVATEFSFSFFFAPDIANQTLLGSGGSASLTTGTKYTGFSGLHTFYETIQAEAETIITAPGTLKNLYARIVDNAGNGNTRIFTVMKNNVASTLTLTITGDGGGLSQTGSDLVNTVSVVAGDVISLRCTNTGTPPSTVAHFSVALETTNNDEFVVPFRSRTNMSPTVTQYVWVWRGEDAPNNTETSVDCLSQIRSNTTVTFKSMYVKIRGGGFGMIDSGYVFTLRKNATATALTLTADDGGGDFSAAADVAIADSDLWDTEIAPFNDGFGPSADPANISYLCKLADVVITAERTRGTSKGGSGTLSTPGIY